jgi:hypothetical protein
MLDDNAGMEEAVKLGRHPAQHDLPTIVKRLQRVSLIGGGSGAIRETVTVSDR